MKLVYFILATAYLAATTARAEAPFRPIPDLGAGGSANSINAVGQIAGSVVRPVDRRTVPALWDGVTASPRELPTDGLGGFATALNVRGQVVGVRFLKVGSGGDPVLWEGDIARDLPTLGEGGVASDINADGVVVGSVRQGEGTRPAVWRDGVLTVLPIPDLGPPGATLMGAANCINDAGVIVGTLRVAFGAESLALRWSGSRVEVAAIAPWVETRGVALDAAGTVLVNGYLRENGPFELATLTPGGTAAVLPLPELVRDVWGTALSGNGLAVGFVRDYSTVPSGLSGLAWSGGTAVPLERPPGMRWALPLDISDAGVVAGYVSDGESGTSTPGIWTLTDDSTASSTIAVTPVEGLPNEAITLTASVRSAAGTPSSGQVVQFALGDTPVGQAQTDATGVARMRWSIPATAKAGTHSLRASALASDATGRGALTVRWITTRLTLAPATARPGGRTTLRGTLVRAQDGRAVAGRAVTLVVSGRTLRVTTDTAGRFTVPFTVPRSQPAGSSLPVRATSAATTNHTASTANGAIVVR